MRYRQQILAAAWALGVAGAALAAPPVHPAHGPAAKSSPTKPPPPKPAPASPQPPAAASSPRDEGTLEVTADNDLEWLQQDHAYVARGNAVAKRGTVTLMGDMLIAYYRPLASPGKPAPTPVAAKPGSAGQPGFDSGTTEIWRVVAQGNVHIISEGRDAYGDRADYDKDQSVVVLTGKNLKATTLTETVTARDSLEYWQDKDMAVARGNALVEKFNGNKLAGDLVGAHFDKDAAGQTIMKTMEAKGNVVITTTTDIVHGDEGTYDIPAQRTVVFGNVRATRGESQLEGQSAEVNMATGISQVFPAPGQRVRGLFVQQKSQDGGAPGKKTTGGK